MVDWDGGLELCGDHTVDSGHSPLLQWPADRPHHPRDWPGFSATRKFRGVTYHITVERAGAGNTATLTVDGQPTTGELVPLPRAGQHDVHVSVALA